MCDEVNDQCLDRYPAFSCGDGPFCNGEEICDEINRECLPGEKPCTKYCVEESDICQDDDFGCFITSTGE